MMPKRDRFIQGLILSAGGALIATGATAPATVDAKHLPNGKVSQDARSGLDWERAPAPQPKRPPNG